MTDTTVRRMTTDEVALLRAVVQWRRAEGWAYVPDLNLYAGGPGTPAVSWSTETGEIGMTRKLDRVGYRWMPVGSVTEAVDLLVMFGFLPARFSSAYRAGWEAALLAVADDFGFGTYDERVRPAVPPAW